jgi:ABC-type sugar transport system, periplasmic component
MADRKRLTLFAFVVIACSLFWVAQSAYGADASKGSASEKIVLRIWLAGTGDPANDKSYRTVFDAYVAKHPTISYELAFIPWTDYFTKLNTTLAGGAGADIFMLGYGQMGTVQANGNLLALDQYIPADWDGWKDFLPNIMAVCKKDGKLQALFNPSTRVYFYRKDIAKQHGVTEADLKVKTPEDLYKLARKMVVRDAKGNTMISGLEIGTASSGGLSPEQQLLVFMGYQTPKPAIWNEDLSPNFNSEAAVKAMKTMYGLFKEGLSLRTEPGATTLGIQSGISAMTLSPEAIYGATNDAFPGQIGIVDCDLPTLLIGNYIAVNAASAHKKEAVDMLLHLFSKESCRVLAKGTGLYSGRASLNDDYVALNPEYAKVVKAYAKSVPLGVSMNPYYNKMISLLRSASESVFMDADPKTALDKAASQYEAMLPKK